MARAVTKKQQTGEFVIEKCFPIPARAGKKGPSKYPFEKMEVGDSFLFRGKPSAIRTSAFMHGSRFNMKFTTRSVDGGVRVWRVK